MIKSASSAVWIGLTLLVPGSLNGQSTDLETDSAFVLEAVRWDLGFSLMGAQPTGDFADYVGRGSGFSLFGVFHLGRRESLRLRVDLELISYGRTTVEVPLSPALPLVDVAVTTENGIASLAVGPELVFGEGIFRPYLGESIGASQFVTTTSVWGSPGAFPIASVRDFEDHTYLLTGGGGIRVSLSGESRHPIGLDIGARYVRHGVTTYLRQGGLREGSGGEILADPVQSETNLVLYQVGVTVGFR